ncbi:MAG TPA: hypothetical protein PLP88_06860 [Bacteroidales bacterium]|nr:hypothetical protein [Bacteroidales bacterium]
MKSKITLFFLLLVFNSFAGTGNANDAIYLALTVVIIMIAVLGIGGFISLLKRGIRANRTWNWVQRHTAKPCDEKSHEELQYIFPVNPAFAD